MDLISLLIVLVIVGVVLYLIDAYVPMDAAVKTVLRVVVVLILCLWLLQVLGFIGPIGRLRIS